MLTISWQLLPAAVGIGILSLAAVSQAVARRVPNVLTLPAIAAAWLFAIHADRAGHAAWPGPAFQASFLGTVLALLIMLPIYRTGRLGAGCVKAQMAFAAWASSAMPLVPALALVASATIGGLAVTFAYLRLAVVDMSDDRRYGYEFPAQVTMTVVAAIGVVACWMISHPA
ncbi:MAG: prepilin peptidase [Planctomycetia bacterium]|nr:prepilin peptidase [Planctomycetia bacterium]